MSARPNASGVSKDEAMVERALAALAKKWGWKPNDGTRDDIRTVLEAALASAAPAGEGDEYRRGYEDGVRATKASPYYDDSADTKPATPAGGGGELPEGGVRLRPGDKLLAVIGEGWVIVEDPLNYYIVREANGSDVIKSARGNDEAEFLAALIRRLASTGSAPAPSADVAALRGFAQSVMEAWPMGDVDGGDLQRAAVTHGLLKPVTMAEPCSEDQCACAEYCTRDEFPVECFRKTTLLTGRPESDARIAELSVAPTQEAGHE